jgi:phosphonate transport system permease protein
VNPAMQRCKHWLWPSWGPYWRASRRCPPHFLGARNAVSQWLFHFGLRHIYDGIRGVDSLLWALMFVSVVGLGPFAGEMAIAVSNTSTVAKLFAEAIESVDRRPLDGVPASRANRLRVMRFGLLSQMLPMLLRHVLYYFESTTRLATVLGLLSDIESYPGISLKAKLVYS